MNRTFLVQELRRLDAELAPERRYAVIRVRHDDPAAAGVALRLADTLTDADGLVQHRRTAWSEYHLDRGAARPADRFASVGFVYGAMIRTCAEVAGGCVAGARPLVFELADLVSHLRTHRAPLTLADLTS